MRVPPSRRGGHDTIATVDGLRPCRYHHLARYIPFPVGSVDAWYKLVVYRCGRSPPCPQIPFLCLIYSLVFPVSFLLFSLLLRVCRFKRQSHSFSLTSLSLTNIVFGSHSIFRRLSLRTLFPVSNLFPTVTVSIRTALYTP